MCFRDHPELAAKAKLTGNPVRPAVVAAASTPYPASDKRLRVLVVGGSQGARILADVVPVAIGRLGTDLRMRLSLVQQAREEDLERVRNAYASLSVTAEVAPFFSDLPARMAASHLVVSRSGASTVAELAAIGRPAILVPLPHALDQDQFANAGVLEAAGGAIRVVQKDFTPRRLAADIAALAAAQDRGLPPWRRRRGPWAGSTPPTSSPRWCSMWRESVRRTSFDGVDPARAVFQAIRPNEKKPQTSFLHFPGVSGVLLDRSPHAPTCPARRGVRACKPRSARLRLMISEPP